MYIMYSPLTGAYNECVKFLEAAAREKGLQTDVVKRTYMYVGCICVHTIFNIDVYIVCIYLICIYILDSYICYIYAYAYIYEYIYIYNIIPIYAIGDIRP